MQEEVDITSAGIKARYLGEDERDKTILDLITYHNTSMLTVLRKGTMKNYYTTERCIKEFLEEEKGIKDILDEPVKVNHVRRMKVSIAN